MNITNIIELLDIKLAVICAVWLYLFISLFSRKIKFKFSVGGLLFKLFASYIPLTLNTLGILSCLYYINEKYAYYALLFNFYLSLIPGIIFGISLLLVDKIRLKANGTVTIYSRNALQQFFVCSIWFSIINLIAYIKY